MASKNLPALPRTPSRDADADYSSQSPGFGPGDGIFFTPAAVADRSSDTAPADVSVSGELTRSFYNPMSFSNLVDAPHPLSKEGYARGTKEPAHGPLERGEMAKLKRSVSAQPRATARQSMPIFPTSHSNYTSIGGLAPPLVYDSVPTQLTAPAGRPQVAGEPARFSSNTSATDGPVSRAPASHVAVCNAPTHNAPMQNAPMHNSPLPSAPPSHPPTNPGPRISPPIAPSTAAGLALPCLIIEFCDRCRWQHRATWVQTELFLTFSAKDAADGTSSKMSGGGHLSSSLLIPLVSPETAGTFRIWVAKPAGAGADVALLWDRKSRGGFPDLSELKRLLRDQIAPNMSLGHSEK